MITFSENAHKPQLIALYNHCFPGESDFCNWFFDNVWSKENTLIYTDGGKLLGMLQMLPVQMEYGGKLLNAAYLYALGTHSGARGRGVMSALIAKSFEISKECGQAFSVLITENDTLFDYYAKYGYKPAFYISKNKIEAQKLPEGFTLRLMNNQDYYKVNLLYSQAVANTLHGIRDEKHFQTMLNIYEQSAWVLCNERGAISTYAYTQKTENSVFATECMGENACVLMAGLAHTLNCTTASWKGVATAKNRAPQGCILPLLPLKTPENSYLNLMFN